MSAHREDLLAAAQRQLNVDATASMGTIAEAAGVGRATLHRHFATREALLTELGTRSLDRWESRLDGGDVAAVAGSGDPARIEALLRELVLGYVEDSSDFGFALTDHVILADAALVVRTERLAAREAVLFAAGQSAGVLRRDVPARWLGHAVYGLLVAGREAVRLGDVAHRDVPDLVLSSFLTGVGAR